MRVYRACECNKSKKECDIYVYVCKVWCVCRCDIMCVVRMYAINVCKFSRLRSGKSFQIFSGHSFTQCDDGGNQQMKTTENGFRKWI